MVAMMHSVCNENRHGQFYRMQIWGIGGWHSSQIQTSRDESNIAESVCVKCFDIVCMRVHT